MLSAYDWLHQGLEELRAGKTPFIAFPQLHEQLATGMSLAQAVKSYYEGAQYREIADLRQSVRQLFVESVADDTFVFQLTFIIDLAAEISYYRFLSLLPRGLRIARKTILSASAESIEANRGSFFQFLSDASNHRQYATDTISRVVSSTCFTILRLSTECDPDVEAAVLSVLAIEETTSHASSALLLSLCKSEPNRLVDHLNIDRLGVLLNELNTRHMAESETMIRLAHSVYDLVGPDVFRSALEQGLLARMTSHPITSRGQHVDSEGTNGDHSRWTGTPHDWLVEPILRGENSRLKRVGNEYLPRDEVVFSKTLGTQEGTHPEEQSALLKELTRPKDASEQGLD